MSLQTYLPYPCFELSALSLDLTRLKAQRVNCMSIINTLDGRTTTWKYHPATKMWRGFRASLLRYAIQICKECKNRHVKDDHLSDFLRLIITTEYMDAVSPDWLGDDLLHKSHRSNLIRLNPEWYQKGLGWDDPNDIPMYWPVP